MDLSCIAPPTWKPIQEASIHFYTPTRSAKQSNSVQKFLTIYYNLLSDYKVVNQIIWNKALTIERMQKYERKRDKTICNQKVASNQSVTITISMHIHFFNNYIHAHTLLHHHIYVLNYNCSCVATSITMCNVITPQLKTKPA